MVIKGALLDKLFLRLWPLDGGLCRSCYRCAPWGHFTLRFNPLSYVIHMWNVLMWLVFTPHLTKYTHFTAIAIHHTVEHWRSTHRKSIQNWWTVSQILQILFVLLFLMHVDQADIWGYWQISVTNKCTSFVKTCRCYVLNMNQIELLEQQSWVYIAFANDLNVEAWYPLKAMKH